MSNPERIWAHVHETSPLTPELRERCELLTHRRFGDDGPINLTTIGVVEAGTLRATADFARPETREGRSVFSRLESALVAWASALTGYDAVEGWRNPTGIDPRLAGIFMGASIMTGLDHARGQLVTAYGPEAGSHYELIATGIMAAVREAWVFLEMMASAHPKGGAHDGN